MCQAMASPWIFKFMSVNNTGATVNVTKPLEKWGPLDFTHGTKKLTSLPDGPQPPSVTRPLCDLGFGRSSQASPAVDILPFILFLEQAELTPPGLRHMCLCGDMLTGMIQAWYEGQPDRGMRPGCVESLWVLKLMRRTAVESRDGKKRITWTSVVSGQPCLCKGPLRGPSDDRAAEGQVPLLDMNPLSPQRAQ
ncbi:hypothetical protein APTSU1_000131800 [Apodemus speciosus]|uniref:Uncharacterized protein n=1 Tax=Apodemus speciosus TaxID=105296 RepID=A0ABQ0EGU9_APOSI